MKIVVATVVDGMVHIYAGVPHGGMEQLGQFAATQTIDAASLATIAVDLSALFGWLEIEKESVSPAINGKPKTITNPTKELAPYKLRERQVVSCGICRKEMARKQLPKHLETQHGTDHRKARQLATARPSIDGVAIQVAKRAGGSKASAAKASRHNRQGLHGAAILEREILPGVLQLIRLHGEQTSRQVADRYDVGTSTGLAWLRKLEARKEIRQLNEPGEHKTAPARFGLVESTNGTLLQTPGIARYDPLSETTTEKENSHD